MNGSYRSQLRPHTRPTLVNIHIVRLVDLFYKILDVPSTFPIIDNSRGNQVLGTRWPSPDLDPADPAVQPPCASVHLRRIQGKKDTTHKEEIDCQREIKASEKPETSLLEISLATRIYKALMTSCFRPCLDRPSPSN